MKSNNERKNEIDCLNRIKDSFLLSECPTKVFDNSDYFLIKSILESARHNEKHNDFPDFFFDGGIIEHFEITASNEKRKGSQYRIDDVNSKKEKDKFFKEKDEEFLQSSYDPNKYGVGIVNCTHNCFSYEYFIKSFKRNAESHLKSLSGSEYNNQTVVFLIEQQAAKLSVYINNKFDRFYKLSEDKKMLQYIKDNLINVRYIFFLAVGTYEIIDLSKIDDLIANAKDGMDIRVGRHNNLYVKPYLNI